MPYVLVEKNAHDEPVGVFGPFESMADARRFGAAQFGVSVPGVRDYAAVSTFAVFEIIDPAQAIIDRP